MDLSPVTIGIICGLAVGVGAFIARTRGAKLAVDVLPVLRANGPLTIPEIMTAMKLSGMNARGKIVMALDTLVRQRQVEEGKVPDGTKQLDKIKVRKYTAVGQSSSTTSSAPSSL